MESWQQLLRKQSIASLEALVAKFGAEHFPELESAFRYLEEHIEIRDVIMSGGDPLLLSDRRIDELCKRLRAIPHLEVIRIGSRVPCHPPERITPELCGILKKYHPLYINTHFNHPDELTPAAVAALGRLADAGVPR